MELIRPASPRSPLHGSLAAAVRVGALTAPRVGMMRSGRYRARDIYRRLSPELETLFEEWKKTHPITGVKPNAGE